MPFVTLCRALVTNPLLGEEKKATSPACGCISSIASISIYLLCLLVGREFTHPGWPSAPENFYRDFKRWAIKTLTIKGRPL